MRTRPFAFALAFAALAPAAGRSADPGPARPDLADLFPARTLLYLEVSDPAALAREARALLKGSTLGDVLAHLPRLRGQGPDFFGPPPAGILGTFLGPEALAEAERFEGAALAVTGLTGGGEPEFVFVLRPGASNLPGFLIRGFLANHPAVRKVGTAEGIDLYQEWYPQFFAPNLAGGPVIPAEEMTPPDGMTYAYAPGAVVIGSGKECVTDVLRRLRGKGKGPGLRQAAGLDRGRRAGPGVFVFADVKRWAEQTEEHYRAAEVVLRPLGWELFQRVVNPAAVRSLTGRLSLEGGNLSLALEARLDPGRRSPLADLCAGAVPGASLPVTAPDDAPLAVTVFLPPAGRAEKLLALADAAAEAFGGLGMLPSEGVRELRQHTGIDAGGAVLGRVGAVTLFLPARQTLPDGAVPLPTVAFHAEADAAEALEELLPAAVGLVAARPAEPVVETIAGQRVRSLPAEGTPWGSALHYGRRGGVLVIGQDRAVVAAA
ncbi:MAG TPA: hypothetical protein VIL46_13155, partial [Gemmataceae bacterium]